MVMRHHRTSVNLGASPVRVIPLGELEPHGKKEKENPISLAILQINHWII
jgi:hypothetical protein